MSAKTEKSCLIMRVDSQYCSTLPQNLEILEIHSRESPHPRSNNSQIFGFWVLLATFYDNLSPRIEQHVHLIDALHKVSWHDLKIIILASSISFAQLFT